MAVQPPLGHGVGHRQRIPGRGRTHPFARHIHDDAPAAPIDVRHRMGRELDELARQPVTCVDDEITDDPAAVVEQHVIDRADVAVRGVDGIAFDGGGAAKMRVAGRDVETRSSTLRDFGRDRLSGRRRDNSIGAG